MIIYRAAGGIEHHDLHGKVATLEQMQTAVGGYIEVVPGSNLHGFCNEDGRLRGLPFNVEASRRFNQLLVGDVIELESGELEEDHETACQNYQPDHNGECLNCDEPADAHDFPDEQEHPTR